jgi:nitrate/TMAO reductase-like tetraheme cytochrome c subunit
LHAEAPGLVQAPCESCHALAPDGILRSLPKESTCKGCHFNYVHDTKKDVRSAECRLCHNPESRVTITRAPGYASLRFAHGDHLTFACAECHLDVEVSTTTAVPLPATDSCTRCHDRWSAKE